MLFFTYYLRKKLPIIPFTRPQEWGGLIPWYPPIYLYNYKELQKAHATNPLVLVIKAIWLHKLSKIYTSEQDSSNNAYTNGYTYNI